MPVRRIPHSRRSVTGIVTGGGRSLRVESTLERDFATLSLFDRDIVSIEEQPVCVRYRHEGRARRYTPDFLVRHWAAPPRLIEVKYLADLTKNEDRYAPGFAAARQYAADRGWNFEVATEADIRTPRLENARFLLPHRSTHPDEAMCANILDAAAGGSSTVRVLVNAVAGEDRVARATTLQALWHLVATFAITVDLDLSITMDSKLQLSTEART